jgi:hypothetical protein
LEKLWLLLVSGSLRVRIGCVWVHVVEFIHIIIGVIWKPVIRGKDVEWRLHMLFI